MIDEIERNKIKIKNHIDFIFGLDSSEVLGGVFSFEFSKTGRMKNFSLNQRLVVTIRPDGGLALTLFGASLLLRNDKFLQNCIIPDEDAIPFISEGRSLFCKHVRWCGSNIYCGSDVVIIDDNRNILAIGRSLFHYSMINKYSSGVAVKIREGIKSRSMEI